MIPRAGGEACHRAELIDWRFSATPLKSLGVQLHPKDPAIDFLQPNPDFVGGTDQGLRGFGYGAFCCTCGPACATYVEKMPFAVQ